jgi:non-canonical (house-cleaning) NTP pyrophosphatase
MESCPRTYVDKRFAGRLPGCSGLDDETPWGLVCSKNPVKIGAVQAGADAVLRSRLRMDGFDTPSGESRQPIGAATLRGADHRLDYAMREKPGARLYCAVESGLFIGHDRTGATRYVDRAIVAIRVPGDARSTVARSAGTEFPARFVEAAMATGWKKVVEDFMMEQGVVDSPDETHLKFGGKSRYDLIREAVEKCLARRFN